MRLLQKSMYKNLSWVLDKETIWVFTRIRGSNISYFYFRGRMLCQLVISHREILMCNAIYEVHVWQEFCMQQVLSMSPASCVNNNNDDLFWACLQICPQWLCKEFDLGTCGTKYVRSVVRFQFYHRRLPNFDEQFWFISRTNIHWRIADFSLLENVCLWDIYIRYLCLSALR